MTPEMLNQPLTFGVTWYRDETEQSESAARMGHAIENRETKNAIARPCATLSMHFDFHSVQRGPDQLSYSGENSCTANMYLPPYLFSQNAIRSEEWSQ
jgi:hypothetical protein